MNNEIVLSEPANELGPVLQKAEEYVRQSKSANTRTAYANDWKHFQNWCTTHRVTSLPTTPETVSLYIADMAESSKPSTIKRHLASISVAHRARGFKNPNSLLVQTTMAGIRRVKGVSKDKKSPVRVNHLMHLGDVLPKNLQGIRDKAIFLIG